MGFIVLFTMTKELQNGVGKYVRSLAMAGAIAYGAGCAATATTYEQGNVRDVPSQVIGSPEDSGDEPRDGRNSKDSYLSRDVVEGVFAEGLAALLTAFF